MAIANDITFSSGSFGPLEDTMFRAASEHALAERLPLVYLAANSGARVGLASEVKTRLQVRPLFVCIQCMHQCTAFMHVRGQSRAGQHVILGIPLVYLAANSGVHVGLASEAKCRLQVQPCLDA